MTAKKSKSIEKMHHLCYNKEYGIFPEGQIKLIIGGIFDEKIPCGSDIVSTACIDGFSPEHNDCIDYD